MKFVFLLLLTLPVFAQPDTSRLLKAKSDKEAHTIANQDLRNGMIVLYVQGGIAPTITKQDIAFEKKYEVDIRDHGCFGMDYKIISAYNSQVFDFLTKKFGPTWIGAVRADIIGLGDYKIRRKF